ncbi:MAG: hypothetical protein ABJ327_23760 [Litoreibacter sp.]
MMPLQGSTCKEVPNFEEVPVFTFGPEARNLLNHLRVAALGCRAAARADLFEACAVLSTSESVSQNAYAETLMKCLGQALEKTPITYRPGVEDISFDEAWLLQAAQSAGDGDWHSFEFLLRSRVPHRSRRNLASLIVSISEQFYLN